MCWGRKILFVENRYFYFFWQLAKNFRTFAKKIAQGCPNSNLHHRKNILRRNKLLTNLITVLTLLNLLTSLTSPTWPTSLTSKSSPTSPSSRNSPTSPTWPTSLTSLALISSTTSPTSPTLPNLSTSPTYPPIFSQAWTFSGNIVFRVNGNGIHRVQKHLVQWNILLPYYIIY